MNANTHELIREAAIGSSEGRLHFGEVLALLVQAGVESYTADYRACRNTYHLSDGQTVDVTFEAASAVASVFDLNALKAAIHSVQQGAIQYPEFKGLSSAAGCEGYRVWIVGRHLRYFGRRGETHVETFPDAGKVED